MKKISIGAFGVLSLSFSSLSIASIVHEEGRILREEVREGRALMPMVVNMLPVQEQTPPRTIITAPVLDDEKKRFGKVGRGQKIIQT